MDASEDEPQHQFDRAVRLHREGRDAQALASLEAALTRRPDWAEAHGARGVILRRLGRVDEALASYDTAIRIDPAAPLHHGNRGNLLLSLRRWDEALVAFDEQLKRAPNSASAHNSRGTALARLRRRLEALESFDAALALQPTFAEALINRAGVLRDLGRGDEALASMEAALQLRPDDVGQVRNWTYILLDRLGPEGALARIEAELARRPDVGALHAARATALQAGGHPRQALASFDRALELGVATPQVDFGRALTLLSLGRFEDGWQGYERRWDDRAFLPRGSGCVTPQLARRMLRWPTAEAFAGREVVLVAEQGVGDVLMFASMIPDLLAIASEVSVVCEARLARLFRASFPDLRGAGPQVAAADNAVVVALGGLGFAFRRQPESFPGRPYLQPSAAARTQAARRLGPKVGVRRIGLSWRGGGQVTGGGRRSVPLADLAPLLGLDGCEFVSLQYGDHQEEIEAVSRTLPRPIRVLPPNEIADFDDLAATVLELDQVVSVQTALIHLAGGLGAPCIVMVPSIPEWRYGSAGEAMPWYGSVRLVRQAQAGDWSSVISRVVEVLLRSPTLASRAEP